MVEQALAGLPVRAAGLEQVERALDVGAHERARALDAAVDVALGREVHDQLGLVLLEQRHPRLEVGDVDALEDVVRSLSTLRRFLRLAA